jgi:long-chain acyl-CoA synthetase
MSKRDICIDRLRQRSIHHKDENAYFTMVNDKWEPITWHDFHEQVRQFGKYLLSLGFVKDTKVAILGFNQLEWVLAAIGAQYVGGISVGVYTASSKEEVSYVVDHSDAQVLVVENLERYRKQVEPIRSTLSKVKLIVLMSNEKSNDAGIVGFAEFMAMGRCVSDADLDDRQHGVDPEVVATMIYTSGTTGNPKSVMLSHATIAWTVRTVVQAWRCGPMDRAVSYLPLAHVAEQMFTLYAPLDCGMQSYFASSFDVLKETIKDVEPTVFFGVPRVFEKFYEGVKTALAEQKGFKKQLVSYLSKVCKDYYRARNIGRMPNFWTSSIYQLGSRKVFLELKKKLGFSKLRICVCGAAPVSKEILGFFFGLDIPVYEVYGQSENAGPASYNLPGQTKLGYVGRPLANTNMRIAEDREILIKGPHVFLGYYKDPAATAEVLKDGWLHTGDIGEIDKDGFVRITDRKKDLLITAGGKNISPQNLEAMLKHLPYVQSAVVVGDSRKYLCALLSPNIPSLMQKAAERGLPSQSLQAIVKDKGITQEIQAELEKINNRLAPVEQIKRFHILPHEFSIESGEFTPTMKVRRKYVTKKYESEIENMYQ